MAKMILLSLKIDLHDQEGSYGLKAPLLTLRSTRKCENVYIVPNFTCPRQCE